MKHCVPDNMGLVPVTDHDHEWLVELHNDPEVLRNLTHPNPIQMKDHLTWWEGIRHDPREQRWIFKVDGERVGFTKFYSIDRVNKNCVLGADIHKLHRGKGLAKFMWSAMLDHAFASLRVHRVSLTTADYNNIGYRVYTQLGFRSEGTLHESLFRSDEYYDQFCMYMLRSDWMKEIVDA